MLTLSLSNLSLSSSSLLLKGFFLSHKLFGSLFSSLIDLLLQFSGLSLSLCSLGSGLFSTLLGCCKLDSCSNNDSGTYPPWLWPLLQRPVALSPQSSSSLPVISVNCDGCQLNQSHIHLLCSLLTCFGFLINGKVIIGTWTIPGPPCVAE